MAQCVGSVGDDALVWMSMVILPEAGAVRVGGFGCSRRKPDDGVIDDAFPVEGVKELKHHHSL